MTAPTASTLAERVTESIPDAIKLRHQLHANPELGYQEHRTASLIAQRLASLNIEHITGLAKGTGLIAHIPATNDPDEAPTIALRADTDALPITEQTGAPYASNNEGVMHACGHDGHTANLLATAATLAASQERPNNVTLLFQPAEEGGAGARRMVEDGALNGTRLGKPADAIFGLHGWPELPLGTAASRPGPLLAATDEFRITVRGNGGHAAFPHNCTDPVLTAAHITTALQHIASRRVAPVDAAVVTVGAINAGTAFNVIPDTATLKGTVRTLLPETRQLAERELRRTAEGIATAMGASAEVEWHTGYPATVNDHAATEHFFDTARRELGNDAAINLPTPFMGGEDFAFYAQHTPACFFIVGLKPPNADTYPGLHTPLFDFNDDALPIAARLFAALATEPLPATLR
jgi:hippurate hydrolase